MLIKTLNYKHLTLIYKYIKSVLKLGPLEQFSRVYRGPGHS